MPATIIGNLGDICGVNMGKRTVLFVPLSTPLVDGADITLGEPKPVTAEADGSFEIDLLPGDYDVYSGSLRLFRIGIDADAVGEIEVGSVVTESLIYTGSGIPALLAAVIGRQTIWIPAAAMTSRTTSGAAAGSVESTTNKVMLPTLDFDAGSQEFAQFQIGMPKSWDRGAVRAEFLWTAASGSGSVVWSIAAVAVSDDDLLDAAFGAAVQVADTLLATTDIHRTAESADVTVAGDPQIGDLVTFQVARVPADAGDTLAVDARLLGVRLFYETSISTDD